MINLRSKLHLARQGRKSSLSNPPCLGDQCDAAIPTQPVGSSPEPEQPADIPTSSTPRPKLEALPEEPLRRVALFCDFDDLLRLRRTCRALKQIFDTLSFFDVSRSFPSYRFLAPPPPDLVPLGSLWKIWGWARPPLPSFFPQQSYPSRFLNPGLTGQTSRSKDGPSHQWRAWQGCPDRHDQGTAGGGRQRSGYKEGRLPLPGRHRPPTTAGTCQSRLGLAPDKGTVQRFGQGFGPGRCRQASSPPSPPPQWRPGQPCC